jgi:hypothetical protein
MSPARHELLRDALKLEEPKVFGLADKTASMKASEVGEIHVQFRSGRRMTLKDVYYVSASRNSLLSLSSLLKYGWKVDRRDGGGKITRCKERLTLRQEGPFLPKDFFMSSKDSLSFRAYPVMRAG